MLKQFYTGNITPSSDTIFVFGSNPDGFHGAGSAKAAVDHFGAIYGVGEGLQGSAYALPTKDIRVLKDHGFRSISPRDIEKHIKEMYRCAEQHPDKKFKIAYRNINEVTLNGYSGIEMIDMFINAAGGDINNIPDNVVFSKEWYDYIYGPDTEEDEE